MLFCVVLVLEPLLSFTLFWSLMGRVIHCFQIYYIDMMIDNVLPPSIILEGYDGGKWKPLHVTVNFDVLGVTCNDLGYEESQQLSSSTQVKCERCVWSLFIIPRNIGKGPVWQSDQQSICQSILEHSCMAGWIFFILGHDQVPWPTDACKIEFGSMSNLSNCGYFFHQF